MVNARSIQSLIVLVVGMFLAIVLGNLLVTDSFTAFAWIGLVLVTSICLYMGRNIWLLIPFMGSLDLGLRIPGQPSTLMLGQILFLIFFSMMFLMRKVRVKVAWTELEFWILILTLFVAQAYVRNPVGVNIFGGDTVGGKPYFLYGIAVVTALIFAGIQVGARELKLIFRVSVIGGLMNAFVSVLGMFVPYVSFIFQGSYTRTDEVNYEDMNQIVDPGASTRITFLGSLTRNIALWVSACISPLKALIRPLWAFLVLFSVLAAAYSGYRNAVVSVALTYFLGLAYRGGIGQVMLSGFGAVGAIALLAVVNLLAPLPPNIQRSLTFLPGTWEQRYRDDAKGSSEWRYEIWMLALTSDKYIHNKWVGDGLGFSSSEFKQSLSMAGGRGGRSGIDEHRENIMVSGDYHSGPVQTIRVIGYVGLVVMLLAMIRTAVHAHRQILRCRGTEWYPLSLFIGIPLISHPIFFTFVFGDFRAGATTLLLGVGMIRMLERNLPLPAFRPPSRISYTLPSRKEMQQRVADGVPNRANG